LFISFAEAPLIKPGTIYRACNREIDMMQTYLAA